MCIKSCKNSPFLKKPTSLPLNPRAEEWRPFQPLPAPQTAEQVVALSPRPPQKLLWHHPHHFIMPFHYIPTVPTPFSHIVIHSPHFSLPVTGRLCAAAPPILGGKKNDLHNCCAAVEKLEGSVFKGRGGGVFKAWRPPPRLVWKPKKTISVGGAAASPPRGVSPSKKVDARAMKELSASSSRTTVMIRNIPNQLRRDFMVEFLDGYCNLHSLEYDFLYLPMDFRSKDNLGYAFVNFTSGCDALNFKKILQNYKWGTVETDKGLYASKKICAITWARIQGKQRLVKRFEDSIFDCDDVDFLPVVFDPPRGGSNTCSPVAVGRLKQNPS